jgi:hypothetical protein
MKVSEFKRSYTIMIDGFTVKRRLELEGKRMRSIDFIELSQFEKELYGGCHINLLGWIEQ